jgi:hypothetical protein
MKKDFAIRLAEKQSPPVFRKAHDDLKENIYMKICRNLDFGLIIEH